MKYYQSVHNTRSLKICHYYPFPPYTLHVQVTLNKRMNSTFNFPVMTSLALGPSLM